MEYENLGSNIASMIGGATIGATLMYFFDPERGPDRREAFADNAGAAARGTGKAISSAWETAREKAGELGKSAASAAGSIGSRTSGIAEDIGESRLARRMRKEAAKLGRRASRLGSRAGSQIGRSTSDIGEKASDFGGSVRDRFRAMLRGSRETAAEKIGLDKGWKQGLAALGLIGLGIGAMYFFDPRRGPYRRQLVRERFFSRYGQRPEDRLVFERVRSEIGRCASKPSLVNAEVRHGRVSLSGPILAREVDGLMKALWNTPGVSEVINRLEIHESLGTFPNVQTSEDAPSGFRSEQAYTEANRI